MSHSEIFDYFEENHNCLLTKRVFEIHTYLGDFVWSEVECSECLYKTRLEAEADCIERLYSRVKN